MALVHHAELAVRRALRNLADFAFTSGVSVGVVATSFLLVGVFLLILVNLSSVLDRWGRDVQVYAYFADGISEETRFTIKEEIEVRDEVAHVHYTDTDEALENFRRLIPDADSLLADLEGNPLPASLEIRLRPDLREPSRVEDFADTLQRPEFVEIDYAGEWVSRFYTFLNLLKLSAVAMGTLLALACIVIVANTIQLAIWARREEIDILRLVGASDRFIEAPFLLEGALQGLLGAGASVGLLWLVYRLLFVELQQTLGLTVGARVLSFIPPSHMGLFCAAGLLLGLMGSWLSLRRVLDRSR
jgi:cell division transport system permease protein